MGEVLSQNEIDNLLAALSSGELDADDMSDASDKQVKNYDFKRPTKFSKEHLRTLEIIYEHYGSYHDYNKANGAKGKNRGKDIAILVKGKIGHQKIRVNAKAFVQFILFGNIIQFLIAFEVEALQSKGNNGVLFL